MKKNVETLPVNLQQGFFISAGRIVAAYNHHTKTVTISMPWQKEDIDLPANYKEYATKYTDGFGIEYWDAKEYKHLALA